MLLDENGLSVLWERVRDYVDAYVTEYDSLAVATEFQRGQVMPDGTTITVDADGVISATAVTEGPYLDIREDADGNRRLAIVIPEEE